MDNEQHFFAELSLAMAERHSKRQWIAIILLIVLLTVTNLAWVIYENSFEDVVITETSESESDEGIAISNIGGDVNYDEN